MNPFVMMWVCAQGLDNETDCLGHITYTHWSYGEAHPKAFTPEDINADAYAPSSSPLRGPASFPLPCTKHQPCYLQKNF